MLAASFAACFGLWLAACSRDEAPPPPYKLVPVERRDIIVSAQAAGTIQPDTTVEVKSKASGEILELRVETGQLVERGTLLLRIDPRQARNRVEQARADLVVAKARLANAQLQDQRAAQLLASQSITQQEREQSALELATAQAEVVRAQVALDNAEIQLEDTDVRSPITGTIIEKSVERGQVISSPTSDVGGGTVLLRMADLSLVQVRTLVDETDIGKIQPGQRATVLVDAYPSRPFPGTVQKIEPLAVTEQNVTMFPVVVRIDNRDGLLRPGMNAEVEVHVGRRDSVPAIPVAALRTLRDVGSAAEVLGLDATEVQRELAAQNATRAPGATLAPEERSDASDNGRNGGASGGASNGKGNGGAPNGGRNSDAPSGGRNEGLGASAGGPGGMVRRPDRARGGPGSLSGPGGLGTPGGPGGPASFATHSRAIVFVARGGRPTPVWITTGLSDLDYIEVVSGLAPTDSVYLLPSASLVRSQQEMRERFTRMTGGGAVPGMRQAPR